MVIMEIVQIVPDEIPETGSPKMEQIRSLALASPMLRANSSQKTAKTPGFW